MPQARGTRAELTFSSNPRPDARRDKPPEPWQSGNLADDLITQFQLDGPGIRSALIFIAQMRNWGVTVTPDIAQACMASFAESDRRQREVLRLRRVSDKSALVYYAQTGDRVKIGFTTNLSERLQSICPERLLAVERGSQKLETARHRQFAALRTTFEWFRYESPLVEHIASLMDTSKPDDLLDTVTAAVAFGVRTSTIRKWAQKGKLHKVAENQKGRGLYYRWEVEQLHREMFDADPSGGHSVTDSVDQTVHGQSNPTHRPR